MLKDLAEDSDIIYIGQLCEKRPYDQNRFGEWKNAFKDNEEISGTIAKIKGILETRAVVGGLQSKLSPVMTKFHLINNFAWKDQQNHDHTTNGKDMPTPILASLPKQDE